MAGEQTIDDGLILVSYGNGGVVELPDGSRPECKYRRSVGRPICGDYVQLERIDAHSVVATAIRPRRNEFARAGARGQKQVIAANLDQVLIVIAPSPAPSQDIVERYLVAVRSLAIRPVIVLNKVDCLGPGGPERDSPLRRLDDYREMGIGVLRTSCAEANGIDALASVLAGCTSILVGQSGVGKSSLANALLPDLELQTGALSRVTGKGTHTTTTTIMYSLPCGGRLVDSPGVWEYGLWQMSPAELAAGYPEFHSHSTRCRFGDCLHRSEPGCAVRAAADRGEIRPWRYTSYLRLLAQAA